jgi:hypothetical protein
MTKLVIEIGENELKHWPAPFSGVAPKIAAWLKDSVTGAMVPLPPVQKLEAPYALRAAWMQGHYRIVFDPGRCYLRAGFTRCSGKTEGGLIVMHISAEALPEPEVPNGASYYLDSHRSSLKKGLRDDDFRIRVAHQ